MIQSDIRRVLAAMPVGVEPQLSNQTKALYVPHLKDAMAGVTATLDIAYGAQARQKLDLYHVDGSKPSAIVIYVPGGGFTGGDKRSDDVFFANVGAYFARRGMLGITMNYRLAPEFGWPSGAQDLDAAVAWARSNAATYGADSSRIVLFGHSAGASHGAMFLFDPEIGGHAKVAGAVLVGGGTYAVRQAELRANHLAYYGTDVARYQRQSVLDQVAGTTVPVLVACAEHDPGFLATPTLELALALARRDARCPPFLRLEGHNHFSPPCSLGTSDDELGSAIISFIKGLPA